MKDRRELERKLEQSRRLSMLAENSTTRQRLEFQYWSMCWRSSRIAANALPKSGFGCVSTTLGEHGSPQGRNQEFWLRAERELVESLSNHS